MRVLKIILAVLVLGLVSALSIGCASEPGSVAVTEDQVVAVQRGDLTIDITAVGNLALSRTEDLAFEIPGTVEEVLVEEGDTVEEGQVLAKLDTSEWEDNLTVLEDRVTAAERQLTVTERQLTTRQRDLLQAQINLTSAEITLEQTNTTYSLSDFKVAQVDVDEAKRNLEETLLIWDKYDEGTPGYVAFQPKVVQAQARLDTAEAKLDAMLSGFDTDEVAIKKLQVEIAEGKLEDAQIAIEDAQIAIGDAQEDVKDAQEALDEAKSDSPEITAPFDGFITKVNVDGGDEVLKGTVAVQLADPAKFEADILVNEMDILQVKLGGTAWVQVDAMQGLSLPAEVVHIAPTATIQQGVVNYTVKVEVKSFEAVMQERQEARQEMMPDITSGELPPRLQQAIEEGRVTQEQAEEMMKRIQSGEMPSPPTGDRRQTPSIAEGGQVPTAIHEGFQLREGLTVTVSIIVDERNDVLLVPNSAITYQGGTAYVQVSKSDFMEERAIQTGVSDWQYTEVIDGLVEGEKVVVPQGTTTLTSQQGRQGGSMGGMGRMFR